MDTKQEKLPEGPQVSNTELFPRNYEKVKKPDFEKIESNLDEVKKYCLANFAPD